MRKFLNEEKGQSLVIVALFLIGLIGFAGIAIDGGRLYIAKSQLQKAVDAAALGGADLMLEGVEATNTFNYTDSKKKADELAEVNYSNGIYATTFPGIKNIIQVDGQEEVSLMLLPVLGLDTKTVNAVAQVKVGKLNSVDKGVVIPIGIQLNQPLVFGTVWELNDQPGEGEKGYFNFLDFSPLDTDQTNSGAKALAEYIEDGSPAPINMYQPLNVQTGEPSKSNLVQNAVNLKAGQIVYVPIVEQNPDYPDDPHKVIVMGFAAFELMAEYDGHSIQAKFIETVEPGEIGNDTSEYGTYASKLIL